MISLAGHGKMFIPRTDLAAECRRTMMVSCLKVGDIHGPDTRFMHFVRQRFTLFPLICS